MFGKTISQLKLLAAVIFLTTLRQYLVAFFHLSRTQEGGSFVDFEQSGAPLSVASADMANEQEEEPPVSSSSLTSHQGEDRQLAFVHIPKTGGTSIERAGCKNGQEWGRYGFVKCEGSERVRKGVKKGWGWCGSKFHAACWHTPPYYLPESSREVKNPYEGKALFAVIRNPYERAISQYYYSCSGKVQGACIREDGKNVRQWRKNPVYMNKFIKNNMQKQSEESYFLRDGHFIPQYDFIFDNLDRRVVDHVLRFEHLEDDFNALMKQYNMTNVKLPKQKFMGKGKVAPLKVSHLQEQTLRWIEYYYAYDFELGGYEMISQAAKRKKAEKEGEAEEGEVEENSDEEEEADEEAEEEEAEEGEGEDAEEEAEEEEAEEGEEENVEEDAEEDESESGGSEQTEDVSSETAKSRERQFEQTETKQKQEVQTGGDGTLASSAVRQKSEGDEEDAKFGNEQTGKTSTEIIMLHESQPEQAETKENQGAQAEVDGASSTPAIQQKGKGDEKEMESLGNEQKEETSTENIKVHKSQPEQVETEENQGVQAEGKGVLSTPAM